MGLRNIKLFIETGYMGWRGVSPDDSETSDVFDDMLSVLEPFKWLATNKKSPESIARYMSTASLRKTEQDFKIMARKATEEDLGEIMKYIGQYRKVLSTVQAKVSKLSRKGGKVKGDLKLRRTISVLSRADLSLERIQDIADDAMSST